MRIINSIVWAIFCRLYLEGCINSEKTNESEKKVGDNR